MQNLSYTVVIATRNRPEALRLSIPRMIAQSRPPDQLIVVDASDDHQATAEAVEEIVGDHPTALMILQSERGLTLQRNLSLPLIDHPLVFFPDDDSIWFPGVASAILDVYEADSENQIAAVCGVESASPPPDWESSSSDGYRMRKIHRLQRRFAHMRARFEDLYFPDPARILGRDFFPPVSALPDWFVKQDVVPVEWMTGFRMSFRTEVIRTVGFDEAFTNYSLFEDIDASFGAWCHGWVVGAHHGRIYHHRSPENRDEGRRLGATQLLNKAYLIAKHASDDHPARDLMVKFGQYKATLYLLGASGGFGMQRFAGARAALKEIAEIAHSPLDRLEASYQASLNRILDKSRD